MPKITTRIRWESWLQEYSIRLLVDGEEDKAYPHIFYTKYKSTAMLAAKGMKAEANTGFLYMLPCDSKLTENR
jgi:hypothetical protein